MCVDILPICMSVHHMCNILGGQKRMLGIPGTGV